MSADTIRERREADTLRSRIVASPPTPKLILATAASSRENTVSVLNVNIQHLFYHLHLITFVGLTLLLLPNKSSHVIDYYYIISLRYVSPVCHVTTMASLIHHEPVCHVTRFPSEDKVFYLSRSL